MRVTITGHRPDSFIQSHYSISLVEMIIDGVVATFVREYDDLLFNLGGSIGIDQWFGNACIKNKAKFYLYLPMMPEVQSRYWAKDQKDTLINQIEHAHALDISDSSGNYNIKSYYDRDKRMVDNSDIVVAFWVGKKKGGTYNTMKYALSQSKFVLNALNSLTPVFSEDLKNGWTPPILKADNEAE